MTGVEVRDSGVGDGSYTIRGHAAVFDSPSLPLGWARFTEEVAPGAFTNVLSRDPHVVANWLHDDRWQLGSTENGTLELREDGQGLYYWVRVAPTSYAADLRVLLERGDVGQCSFCFTIGAETWTYAEDGDDLDITARIEEVEDLYDVTVCPMGAYPATDLVLANKRDRVGDAIRDGRIPNLPIDKARASGFVDDPEAAPAGPAAEAVASDPNGSEREKEHGRFRAMARAKVKVARAQLP